MTNNFIAVDKLTPARALLLLAAVAATIIIGAPDTHAQNPPAQAPPGERPAPRSQVIVSGDSLVQAQPDTAVIQIAVVTQNKSALAAQEENARRSEAVSRAVRTAAGANAEIKTSGYTVQPQYQYRQNQTPLITGYEARNSVLVTLSELNRVGATVDAATTAGANSVDSLRFILRRDQPVRQQALADATREAMAKAQAVAAALGGRITRIVEVQEAGTVRPRPPVQFDGADTVQLRAVRENVPTPIEAGTLDVTSQVQLTVEIDAPVNR